MKSYIAVLIYFDGAEIKDTTTTTTTTLIYLRVLLAVVCYRKFILFVNLLLLAKAKCTRVLGAFFDRVPNLLTFEYKY